MFRIKLDTFVTVALVALLLLGGAIPAQADSVTANSGSSVSFLDSGSQVTDFPSPFTAGDFLAAQTGPAAFVVAPNPAYIPALPDGPGAVWIGTNPTAGLGVGDTALYAISFNIPTAVSSASLNLFYAVDNLLGENNAGIYINGVALPGSTGLLCSECETSFNQENNYNDPNIGSLLVNGTNWIYFDDVNQGGPAAIMFSADLSYTPSIATPEPASLFLLGAGLLGVAATRRRRKSCAA